MPYKFQMYIDRAGDWRWRFIAPNNKKMADSGEGYKSESGCMNAIEVIRREADQSKITSSKIDPFLIYLEIVPDGYQPAQG